MYSDATATASLGFSYLDSGVFGNGWHYGRNPHGTGWILSNTWEPQRGVTVTSTRVCLALTLDIVLEVLGLDVCKLLRADQSAAAVARLARLQSMEPAAPAPPVLFARATPTRRRTATACRNFRRAA